jgi:predicted nucleic acid-binding protein
MKGRHDMATKILDSYAVLAFLEDEPGADAVRNLILKAEEGGIELAMSVVNLGEVWYAIARTTNAETADRYIQEIQGMAIEVVDVNWALMRQAAAYKAKGKISYADCFVAALAQDRDGEIVTGDKEFQMLEEEN